MCRTILRTRNRDPLSGVISQGAMEIRSYLPDEGIHNVLTATLSRVENSGVRVQGSRISVWGFGSGIGTVGP